MNELRTTKEPEIHREQQVLNDRLEMLDKSTEGLQEEIAHLESTLKIALRPRTPEPAGPTIDANKPERPLCQTSLGSTIREKSDTVDLIARHLNDLSQQLQDIRERCELPRMTEEVQAPSPHLAKNQSY